MADQYLERIRTIVLALPEVNERLSHGAPSFHGAEFADDERVSIWCPAPPGGQEERIPVDPVVFFAPTPSASGVFKDWVTAFLDDKDGATVDWDDIAEMIEDAYRHIAPTKLIAELDALTDRR